MKSWLTLFVLFVLVSTLGYTQVTNKLDNLQVGTLTTKTIDVTSTVKASKPCPKMTQVERDAIVGPLEGQCIYNSTAKTLNLYDGVGWVEVAGGGEGGIANWEPATSYNVDDVVIYSGNIYQCITLHTSGASFDPSKFNILAQDLASATGSLDASKIGTGVVSNTEFSYLNNASSEIQTQLNGKEPTITTLPLSKGGTNKNITALAGAVAYSDGDSLELTNQGTLGQFLQSNGNLAPSWEPVTITDTEFSGVLSLSKGGSNKNLTAQDKAIVYSDSDSLELLAPGTTGQVLKMGALAPEWGNAGVSVSNNYATATELSKLTVPNEVLTEQATGEYYLEKNNNNILRDPSFEGGSYATIWSVNVSSDQFGTGAIDGGYTLRALPSSQIVSILQDSSLYVDAFADGSVQGMASARIKTSVSGVKLCPRKAAVTQTNLCVTHTGSGKWEHLKVPFILGDTSNGLVILTETAKTGTIYVDDAFLGAVDLSATQSFDTTCDTVACQTEFSIKVSGGGATIFETNDWASSTRNATGNYVINLNSGVFSVSPSCQVSTSESGNYVDIQIDSLSPTAIAVIVKDSATTTFRDKQFEVFCQKQGADYTAAINAQKAFQKTKVSSYSSTNADTDWQSCNHTTASFTGFGTPTLIETQCKRDGGDLLMKGKFNSVSPTAVEARVSLPIWNGVQLTSKGSPTIPSIQIAGHGGNSTNTSNGRVVLIEPSVSYITFGVEANGAPAGTTTKVTGSTALASGDTMSFTSRIPIQGWENSNIIIGQFNGLEKCESTLDCTDTFSARVSTAGVVSSENVDWINGNSSITNTSTYSIPFNSGLFSVIPNCTVTFANTASDGQNLVAYIRSESASSISVRIVNGSTAVAVANAFSIICQKQGADYIGKLAKAVASDQNTRMPGITNSKICSANIPFSAGYSLGKHYGACVSSVNSSTGAITFNSGYWTDTPNCTCTAQGSISTVRSCYIDSGVAYNVNGVKFQTADGATNANNTFYFTCTGY